MEFSLWVASRFQRQASSASFTPRVGRRAIEKERRGREGSRTQQLVTRASRKLAELSFTCTKLWGKDLSPGELYLRQHFNQCSECSVLLERRALGVQLVVELILENCLDNVSNHLVDRASHILILFESAK